MGNDIKLPVSQTRKAQELNEQSQREIRQQLISEIETVTVQKNTTLHQIQEIENSIKQLSHNIAHYESIILKLSLKMNQIELEQINVNLAHDSYVMKNKEYLRNFPSENSLENDPNQEKSNEYSTTAIKKLEEEIKLLNEEVTVNEKIIGDKMKSISSI